MGHSTYAVLTYNPEGTTTRRQRSNTTFTALPAALTHAWQQGEVQGWYTVDATAQHLSGAQGWGCLLQTKRNSEEVRVIIGHPGWARGEDAVNLADAVLATIGNMVAANRHTGA
ncbi:hypothetical protein [Rhodococcus opacus]|uniref:hypothetical protein n=1 Tax=Rhodococcus opacus TaxID=37919 RepID=UPI00155B3589|nr:hypothetical protein [Rhodococcus opacus]